MFNIEIAKSTACVMLKNEGELIDYKFINKFHFDNFLTKDELDQEIKNIMDKNSIDQDTIFVTMV